MQPSFCIGFQVHHPLSFVDHDPLNVEEAKLFTRMSKEVYGPFFDWMHGMMMDNPQFKGFLSLSGSFLDYCDDHPEIGDDVLDQLRRIVSTQRIDVVTEPYHTTLHAIDDQEVLLDQVQQHHNTLHGLFGTRTRFVRMFKHKNYESTALLMQYIGFEGVLFDVPGTECKKLVQRVLTMPEWRLVESMAPVASGGQVFVVDHAATKIGLSKQIKQRFLEAFDAGIHGASFADEIIEEHYPYVQESFVIDIENICTRGKSVKDAIAFSDQFFHRLMSRQAGLCSLDQWVEQYEPEKGLTGDIDQLVLDFEEKHFTHPLQKTAWDEFKSLVDAFEEGDHEELDRMVATIDWLGKKEHFHAMVSEKSAYDSPYEAFETYIQKVRDLRQGILLKEHQKDK